MKEGDLVRHLMDGQTGIVVLAWGVMDVVEVPDRDWETNHPLSLRTSKDVMG